jgi:hypothetical protein
MAAPVPGIVTLPLDTGNTGKKKRTQTRTVGADSVHSDYVVIEDSRSVLGVYRASIPVIAVPIAAHTGTTTGFAFIYNPVGSVIKMQISRLEWRNQFRALAVDLLAGDLRVSRFTFTGVNSGTQVTPARRDSTDAANVGQVSITWATAVATVGATLCTNFFQTMDLVTGGAGHWSPAQGELSTQNEHEEVVLRAGEGIVVWNASGVTTANRGFALNVNWDEFE